MFAQKATVYFLSAITDYDGMLTASSLMFVNFTHPGFERDRLVYNAQSKSPNWDGSHFACFDPSLSPFLRFRTVWYEVQYLSVCFLCCYIPLQHTQLAFLRTTFAAFPTKTSKWAKYRIIVFSILCPIWPRPMPRWPSVAQQDGGIWTYFDDPWKIENLTKSKHFCGTLLQKISCIILGKKSLVLRAL